MLEIGPGPGGLTRAILRSKAASIVAVEQDARCLPILHELEAVSGGRLRVLNADALEIDERSLAESRLTVVANLPFNVGTALLLKWFGRLEVFAGLTVMLQKEVARRIAATPSTAAYGRLSVLAQWLCRCEIAFDVPARAFLPPPEVDASVLRLIPRDTPAAPADRVWLERVLAATFGQRRKMLRKSLRSLTPDADRIAAGAGIVSSRRPETLTVEEFCALARAVARSVG